MGNFNLAEALATLTNSTSVDWSTFNLPIPENVVIFTTNDGRFKVGDGVSTYASLPSSATLSEVANGQANLINVLNTLLLSNNDAIIIINNEMYNVSGTTMGSIISRINAITTRDAEQDSELDVATSQNSLINSSISVADNDKLAIVTSHKVSPGMLPTNLTTIPSDMHLIGITPYSDINLDNVVYKLEDNSRYYIELEASHDVADRDSLVFNMVSSSPSVVPNSLGRGKYRLDVSNLSSNTQVTLSVSCTYESSTIEYDLIITMYDVVSKLHISGVSTYSNLACTITKDEFSEGDTGYCKIVASHDTVATNLLTTNLTCSNLGIVITNEGNNIFRFVVSDISVTGNITLKAEASYEHSVIYSDKLIYCNHDDEMLAAVYGGASSDRFYGITIDASNNIICVGFTQSEGVGIPNYDNALVVKFDSNLNILARKVYSGADHDYFYAVAVDASNNIICAGSTRSEGAGSTTYYNALVVKFDSNLNILIRKVYSGANDDHFFAVAIDASNNIICAGSTRSEGVGNPAYLNALVVKFNSSLSITARKTYSGANDEEFYAVAIDASSNIICAGYTYSEGTGTPSYHNALVVKFNSSLTILARKTYGGANDEEFRAVAIDASNNIICVGSTYSEGTGTPAYLNALVVKFDSSLNILARKIYGGTSGDEFYAVAINSSNSIICAGFTKSEGAGSTTYANALVVKFDSSLTILSRKVYGGAYDDEFYAVAIDDNNNIFCTGYAQSDGSGSSDALILKLPADPSSGTFTGTVLTGLTLADSTLTLDNSNLTLADSGLTLADSALTLTDSTLTLAVSTLTLEKDAF